MTKWWREYHAMQKAGIAGRGRILHYSILSDEKFEGRHIVNHEEHRAYHRDNVGASFHECHDAKCPGHEVGNVMSGVRYFPPDSNTAGEPDRAEIASGELTGQEKTLLEMLDTFYGGFRRLERHWASNDKHEVSNHVFAIRNNILARAAARANPDLIRHD